MWISGCLASSHDSILINGSPPKEFPITIRVGQGDPLFPFLYNFMEGLNVAMRSTCNNRLFSKI